MRCPKCGRLNLKASREQASIKCVFCGGIFRASETPNPKARPAGGAQVPTDVKAAAQRLPGALASSTIVTRSLRTRARVAWHSSTGRMTCSATTTKLP